MQNYEILLVILGGAAAVGLFVGKGAQLIKLPSIIGYMLLGTAIGLSGFHLLTEQNITQLTFLTDIALGFVAFVIGAELNIQSLKRQSKGVVAIIFVESFGAFSGGAGERARRDRGGDPRKPRAWQPDEGPLCRRGF